MIFFKSKKIAKMKEIMVYTLEEQMKMILIYGTTDFTSSTNKCLSQKGVGKDLA